MGGGFDRCRMMPIEQIARKEAYSGSAETSGRVYAQPTATSGISRRAFLKGSIAVGIGLGALLTPNYTSAESHSHSGVGKNLFQRLRDFLGISDYKVLNPELIDSIPSGLYDVIVSEEPAATNKYNAVLFLNKGGNIVFHHSIPRQNHKGTDSPDEYLKDLTQGAISFAGNYRIEDPHGNVMGYLAVPSGTLLPTVWYNTKKPSELIVDIRYGSIQAPGGDGGAPGGAAAAGGRGFGFGGTCLLNGSLVLINNTDTKKVEDLEIGNEVLALDLKRNKTVNTKITKIIKNHPREFFYCINGNLFITNDHPVLVFRDKSYKWCRVEDLLIGDKIKSLNGFTEVITIIKILKPAVTVYIETGLGNYIVKGENNYYVINADYKDKKIEEDALEVEALTVADKI